MRFHGEGMPTKEIARRIGASHKAVRRWVRAGRFMPYRRAPGPSRLDRHLPFVENRWQEGERNATVLHRELRAQGFKVGYDIVRRWAVRNTGQGHRSDRPLPKSPRRITRWLTGDPATLLSEDRAFTEALCVATPKHRQAVEDVRAFAELLRRGDPAGLTPWLEAAGKTDLGDFVTGLRQDEAAIRAPIIEPWSNGPVEGQVNRIEERHDTEEPGKHWREMRRRWPDVTREEARRGAAIAAEGQHRRRDGRGRSRGGRFAANG